MSCYNCKAKHNCSSAVQEGSVMCMVNKLHYGGTHGEEEPQRQVGSFCQYCGKPLKVYGSERFCNNPRCQNRYVNV
jgi:hypothetical protein